MTHRQRGILTGLAISFSLGMPSVAFAAGELVGWGNNTYGQIDVPAGNDFTAVAAGQFHGLALKADGSLVGWGDNPDGQTDVPSGYNFTAVAAGWRYGVALRTDGSLVAWGDNGFGQVGGLPAGSDFAAVSAGGGYGLALKTDGSLVAWGDDGSGQVSDVPAGNDFIAIAAGGSHGLAIKADGSLVGWGWNAYGQIDVPAGNDFTGIVGGDFHSLALRSDGSVTGWGFNSDGQADAPPGNNFIAIAVGDCHSLALSSDASIVSWGQNSEGQTDVPPGIYFGAMDAYDNYSLAVTSPLDCNANGIPDECDIDCTPPCDIPGCGGSTDCDESGIPDECEVEAGDCNANNILDVCEVAITVLLEEGFDSGLPSNWTATGLWHTSDLCPLPDECDATDWARFGLDTPCDFDTGEAVSGSLTGPPFTIPAMATMVTLTYCSAYEGEAGDANVGGYDWAWVEVCVAGDCTEVDDVGFDNDQLTWEQRVVDLAEFAGQNVELRWEFDSMDALSNTERGWQVDDIIVQMGPSSDDCQPNGIPDECDLDDGTSFDCNENDIPDECDVADGTSEDCQPNGRPDECELVNNDCDGNDVPDECDPDCQPNGIADACDIVGGTSEDCTDNGIPDECEPDCQPNGSADSCDIDDGTSSDCNFNGVPDECEPLDDCQPNGNPDICDIAECPPGDPDCADCNGNGVPDFCDIRDGTSEDVDPADGVPDECGLAFMEDTGPTTGGTEVTITGTNLDLDPVVTFGGVPVDDDDFVSVNPTELIVRTPAFPPGAECATETTIPVAVVVTLAGSRPLEAEELFTYEVVSVQVPGDSPTIQEAIGAAQPGTCIVVAPGAYTEVVTFSPLDPPLIGVPDPRRAITLTSETVDNPTLTRIRTQQHFDPLEGVTGPDPVVMFDGNDDTTVITGFNLMLGNGGIVVQNGASPWITKNRIENNFASSPGGGIAVLSGSSPTIEDNHIVQNTCNTSGGGIAIVDATATLIGNNISGNVAQADGGGISLEGDAPIEISGQVIAGNSAGASGGGVSVATGQAVTLSANEILSNVAAGDGGGVYLGGGTSVTLSLNRIVSNQTEGGSGGGVYVHGSSSATLRTNLFSQNEAMAAGSSGGGIFAGPAGLPDIEENVVRENAAQYGGGIICLVKGEPYIYRNIIAFNQAVQRAEYDPQTDPPPFFGPGILVGDDDGFPGPGPMIINNTIHQNTMEAGEGAVETGGIHGFRLGVFQPNWINNIISQNHDWGIYCNGTNSGARIEYNDLFANPSGTMCPDCDSPGGSEFVGNVDVDPLFVDPSVGGFDFSLDPASPVRGAGEGGVDMGAVWSDGIVGSAGGLVEDTSSSASVEFPAGVLPADTEVSIRVEHLPPDAVEGQAATMFIDFLLIPDPGAPLDPPVTLTLPLRTPMEEGSSVALYLFDDVLETFVDTGIVGTVDSSGRLAVFEGVDHLSTFVGSLGEGGAVCAVDHPADTNHDHWVVIGEASAYAHCWRTGCTWPVPPNPVPVGYMTRGGLLWKLGERYCCDADQEEPLNWVNCSARTGPGAELGGAFAADCLAVRVFEAAGYVAQQPMNVTIEVTPDPWTAVYALEEAIPSGWETEEISHDGVFDNVTGKLKWGPFFDSQSRTLTYQVIPPIGDSGLRAFSGVLSVNGFDGQITGSSMIGQRGDANSDGYVDLLDFAVLQACFTGAGGHAERGCEVCNFNGDTDVDLADFTAFRRTFMGTGR